MFCYIDDVFLIDNSRFGDYFDCICPIKLEMKNTTDTERSDLNLDFHLEIDDKES